MEKNSKILLSLFVIFLLSAAVFVTVVKRCNVDITSNCSFTPTAFSERSEGGQNAVVANDPEAENINVEIEAQKIFD